MGTATPCRRSLQPDARRLRSILPVYRRSARVPPRCAARCQRSPPREYRSSDAGRSWRDARIKQGHAPVVTMLMAAGAPVQHLIRAASVGDSEQLLVLLKAGAAADTEVASRSDAVCLLLRPPASSASPQRARVRLQAGPLAWAQCLTSRLASWPRVCRADPLPSGRRHQRGRSWRAFCSADRD